MLVTGSPPNVKKEKRTRVDMERNQNRFAGQVSGNIGLYDTLQYIVSTKTKIFNSFEIKTGPRMV